MDRKPVVAFGNGRLVAMLQHSDCVEYKTRFQTQAGVLHASALLYQDGEVWYFIGAVGFENTDAVERYEAEAFLKQRDAEKASLRWVMFVKSTLQVR